VIDDNTDKGALQKVGFPIEFCSKSCDKGRYVGRDIKMSDNQALWPNKI